MKRKLCYAAILFLVLIFVMVSCASTDPVEEVPPAPPVETAPPVTPPPPPVQPESASQEMIDALNAAKSLADTNRTLSLEVESPEYFPNEWNAIEAQYVQANEASLADTNAAYQAAADSYNKIAADFEAVALDALPLYAEDFYNRGIAERTAAIDAGIVDIDPERFLVAEDYAVSALAAWEIQDYETAIAGARNAVPRYTALKIGADAYHARMDIAYWIYMATDTVAYHASIGLDYSDYDAYQATLDAADEDAFLAIDQYDSGDISNALVNAEKALAGYNTTINQAYTDAATIIGDAATNAQKKAVDTKAPVAAKPEYDEAAAIYARGQTFRNERNYQGAAENYYQSIAMFLDVAELSEYKRQQALAAIEEAERRIAASDQSAEEAEARLGGGTR